MNNLFAELRRRKVFRVAALYVVAAWVVIQVTGEAFDAWSIPDGHLRLVWIAAALGFVPALVFGWRYDFVGGRIVRTPPATGPIANPPLAPVDYAVLAALLGVVGAIVFTVARQASDITVDNAGPTLQSRSVAVLPFENMSGDETNRAFTVGLHDDILTQIAKIGEVKVISRTSVARIEPGLAIRDIGTLLGVASVLEGGVQRVGDELRVNVQLIDVRTDQHLWAETFNGRLSTTSIFAVQSDIATSVAAALRATLSPRERRELEKVPTSSLEAYQAYLLGKRAMALRNAATLREAQDHLARAIDLDPSFANAYVALADTARLLSVYGNSPREAAIERAGALLERALAIDPELGAAYASKANGLTMQGRPDEAATVFERAIELDPNYAPAFHWYGDLLINTGGSLQQALNLLERARALDPLSPVINVTLGEALEGLGHLGEATAVYRRVLDIQPDFAGACFQMGQINRFGFGRLDDGARWHTTELALAPDRNPALLGFVYLELGDDETARRWFERARATHPGQFATYAGLIEWHRYRGDAAQALALVRELDALFPLSNLYLVTMAHFGRDEEMLRRFEEIVPDFSCDEPAVDRGKLFQAINVSLAMERTGRTGCAEILLDAALAVIDTMPRLGGRGYGIADVEIHARRGQKALALAALQRAVDEGWRASWRAQGLISPHTRSLVNDPEFVRIMATVQADVADQLANVRKLEAAGNLAGRP